MSRICFWLMFFALTNCQPPPPPTGEKPFRLTDSIMVDGRTRTYLLNLPPNYYAKESAGFSLVIGMHGSGGNADQFEHHYRFTEKANSAGFIAVYPEGVKREGVLDVRTWNAGTCCDYAKEKNVKDVQFIQTLIDTLIARYKINPKRIYVAGMSNGGMMAYRLACEIPDKITAIAAISASMVVYQACNPSRAVPLLHIHSIQDTKIPYQGGVGIGGYYFPPLDSVLRVWTSLNTCATEPQVQENPAGYTFTRWTTCASGNTVDYYLTRDGGHAWPGGMQSTRWSDTPSTALNANEIIWDFFQRFELPE